MMLSGMEGSSLGVWVAHGEGRAHFADTATRESAVKRGLAPVRWVVGCPIFADVSSFWERSLAVAVADIVVCLLACLLAAVCAMVGDGWWSVVGVHWSLF